MQQTYEYDTLARKTDWFLIPLEKLKVERQERALLQIRTTQLEAIVAERTAALEKTIAELEQAQRQLAAGKGMENDVQ